MQRRQKVFGIQSVNAQFIAGRIGVVVHEIIDQMSFSTHNPKRVAAKNPSSALDLDLNNNFFSKFDYYFTLQVGGIADDKVVFTRCRWRSQIDFPATHNRVAVFSE